MKIEIDFPQQLFERMEEHAEINKISVEKLIQITMEDRIPEKRPKDGNPIWQSFGMLAHLRNENARIMKIIDDEFGQIEEEDWK